MEISEEEMEKSFGSNMEDDVATCEVPFGGMLLLNNCIPHRSLENFSDKIRWSMDLRWHDPNKPTGFYNLKKSVIMRKADDPDYKINWEGKALHSETSVVIVLDYDITSTHQAHGITCIQS